MLKYSPFFVFFSFYHELKHSSPSGKYCKQEIKAATAAQKLWFDLAIVGGFVIIFIPVSY